MDIDQTVRAAWNETAPHDQWIVEIAEDYIVVTDEKDRSFSRVPVLVGDSVEFGAPVRVMPGYIPFAEPVAASRVVFASRAESRPEVAAADATVLDPPLGPTPQPPPDPRPPAEPAPPAAPPEEEPLTPPRPGGVPVPTPHPEKGTATPGAEPEQHNQPTEPEKGVGPVSTLSTDVRSRLGLPDDADDAAVVAALDALKTKAESPPQSDPAQVAASTAAVEENTELRKEVTILASQVQQVTAELAATKADKAKTVKASVLDEAQKLGKFTPAEREQWEKDYDEAPAAITRTLARISAGAAVPVQASGYTGGGDEAGIDDEYESLVAALDGPYAKKEVA